MINTKKIFYRHVLKALVVICAILVLCRLTNGMAAIALVGLGFVWALMDKIGLALCCYIFFPYVMIINPAILPKTSMLAAALRIGPMVMTFALMISATRRAGRNYIPLGGLLVYLLVATISSIGGYCFQISLLKVINFFVFFVGIWVGTRNLDRRPADIELLRVVFFSLSLLTIFGSIATLPYPAIAYPLTSRWLMLDGAGMTLDEANAAMRYSSDGLRLFAGFTMHSQTLAPMMSCIFGYVLCDMISIERRLTAVHLIALVAAPILLYMTRSRTGMFSLLITVIVICFYAREKIPMNGAARQRIKKVLRAMFFVGVVSAVAMECKDNTISKWLLKNDDTIGQMEKMGVHGSIVGSRMGMVEKNLYDFSKNPVFGMGFQVDENSASFLRGGGLVFSAPVEKGILPLMVLGETGTVGAICFLLVMIVFYSKCTRNRYVVSASLFTTLLATNIGEATFFSPGGCGGIMWMYCCVGGFAMDMIVLYRRRFECALIKADADRVQVDWEAERCP